MRILGIDPGTTRVGFGVIEAGKDIRPVAYGTIGVEAKSSYLRLKAIERDLRKIIKKYHPEVAAVEKLFFAKNQKTAMAVSEARGVILLVLGEEGVQLKEYAPSEVKSAVAGSGVATKRAVEKIVALILKIPKIQGFDDASDALALAIRASFEKG